MKDIKAVLFDMDGVLTDTEKYYHKFWLEAARECGYTEFTREDALDLRSGWRGYTIPLMKARFGEDFDFMKVRNLCADKMVAFLEENGIELKPGVHEIMKYLKGKDIKIALVTATELKTATARLTKIGLIDYFDKVISAHELERGKPFPEPYLYACKEIGVEPEDAIAVEDSPNGVKSAIAAGCNTVMIPDLTGPTEEFEDKLYACLESLVELKNIL